MEDSKNNAARVSSSEETTGSTTLADIKEQAREEQLIRAVVHEVVAVIAPQLEKIFAPRIQELSELVVALTSMRDDMETKQGVLNTLFERCPRLQGNGEDCSG